MSENKNKLSSWMQKNRYYIVLALCIVTVSATYMLLKTATAPETQSEPPQTEAQFSEAPKSDPLPDLADYFPPELEPDVIKPQTETDTHSANTPAPDAALQVSGTAPNVEKEAPTFQFPLNGAILKPYSGNTLIFSKTMTDWRTHSGIDIAAEAGTDVCACADGIIEDIYTDERMGITIVIDHQNGIRSVYSNLSSGLLVEIGQSISRGEVISTVGNSALFEAADESHLHLEMTKDGALVDPLTVLK